MNDIHRPAWGLEVLNEIPHCDNIKRVIRPVGVLDLGCFDLEPEVLCPAGGLLRDLYSAYLPAAVPCEAAEVSRTAPRV